VTTNCPPRGGADGTPPGQPPPRPDAVVPPVTPDITAYYGWAAVCETIADAGGLNQQFIYDLFKNILGDHFADEDRIWDSALHTTLWNRDPALSKLSIFPVTLVKRDVALDRPGIVVKRGPFKSSRLSIGDTDGVDGGDTTRMIEGAHTFVAVGNSGPNANALGWEVFNFFEAISPILRAQFGMDIAPEACGEIAVLKDLGEQLAVPVVVSYRFLSTVRTSTIDPAIKVTDFISQPQV